MIGDGIIYPSKIISLSTMYVRLSCLKFDLNSSKTVGWIKKIMLTHNRYAEELSFVKRMACSSHALGFWHLWLVTHSKTLCVFYLKIKLQFVTLDGAKFGKFHHGTLSQG